MTETSLPQEGGSFTRDKDGSLKRTGPAQKPDPQPKPAPKKKET